MVEYLDIDKKDGSNNGGSVNADAGMSDQEDFNFEKELEEYKGMVKDMNLKNVEEGIKAELTVISLEGTSFNINWSVA